MANINERAQKAIELISRINGYDNIMFNTEINEINTNSIYKGTYRPIVP